MLRISQLSFSYSTTEEAVIKRASLNFNEGEFSLVIGPTGSGKTTLLKTICRLAPNFTGGKFEGEIWLDDTEVSQSQPNQIAELIGYVGQNPELGFVTQTVREELAYGMEQLGFEVEAMQERISTFASLLELSDLLDANLSDISGGEQQRVAIGAALTAGQKILLLDEPTSALDPEIADKTIKLLRRIASETATTVILSEHRIERVLEFVDSVVQVQTDGRVIKAAASLTNFDNRTEPPIFSLGKKLGWQPLELSLEKAKQRWQQNSKSYSTSIDKGTKQDHDSNLDVATVHDLSVGYGSLQAVVGVSFSARAGTLTALMGSNGSGKSSALWGIQGTKPSADAKVSGQVLIKNQDPAIQGIAERLELVAMVPQKASDLLFLNSLGSELAESDASSESEPGTTSKIFEKLAGRINPAIHPRDLSTGQQIALVLASQLVKGASLILLDEPTRGLDYIAKRELAETIGKLKSQGKAVIMASHDIEFVAEIGDQVLILENGRVVNSGTPTQVLSPGSKYSPQLTEITQTPGVFRLDQIAVKNV